MLFIFTFSEKKRVMRVVLSLFIFLFSLSVFSQSAHIQKSWIESNINVNNDIGTSIHIDLTVEKMKGKEIRVLVFFYDQYKESLKSTIKEYRTTSNDFCVWRDTDCPYENTRFKDLKLFIPNSILFYCPRSMFYRIFIRDDYDHTLGMSDYLDFQIKGDLSYDIKNQDGSHHRFTSHEDGSTTSVSIVTCYICFGSCVCQACKGSGSISAGYGEYRIVNVCALCGGSGRCRRCNGTGKSSSSIHYDPKTNMSTYVDLVTGETSTNYVDNNTSFGNTDYNTNTYSSPQKATGKKQCTFCNGTGKSPVKSTGPNFTGNVHYDYCSICNSRSERHYHDVCPSCKGLGYY